MNRLLSLRMKRLINGIKNTELKKDNAMSLK